MSVPPRQQEPKPHQQTQPRSQQVRQTSSEIGRSITFMESPEHRLQFGRARSLRTRVDLQIDINAIERVAESTYNVMEYSLDGLLGAPITRANFIRVTKTLILKRLHDVQKATPVLNIGPGIVVPQPIGELLYALDNYYCDWNGVQYTVSAPPAPAADPPSFYKVDAHLLSGFVTFCSLARYKMVPFPKFSETTGLPLMLLTKKEENQTGQVRGVCLVPSPADCFLRFVHEELFVAPPFTWADSQ